MNEGLEIYVVKGRAPISGMIQGATRSVYSHTGLLFHPTDTQSGCVFEAESEGFYNYAGLHNNNQGCLVDCFAYDDPLTIEEVDKAYQFCWSWRGAGYDLPMVIAFLQKLNFEVPESRKLLFCSEIVFMATANLGPNRILFRNTHPWQVDPGLIPRSTRIHWTRTLGPQHKP